MMPDLYTATGASDSDGGGIEILPWDPGCEQFEAIADLFTATWPKRYVRESARMRLMDHATIKNFSGLMAVTYQGRVAGFCYGHTCYPGQWWHDQVHRWLGDERTEREVSGSFNFTELAVDPQFQRRGIGRALEEGLIGNCGHEWATLSTPCGNAPAIELYLQTGWGMLLPKMFFADVKEPFAVMGRYLGRGGK
jgi:ribosomal protein S18 acetylase RimI-like enzyme